MPVTLLQEKVTPCNSYALLKSLLHDTARFVGDAFMRAAVESLARGLGADFVFISQTVHGAPGTVRMLAVHREGQAVDGWTFQLCGTPCDLIYREKLEDPWSSMKIGRSIAVSDRVRELFEAARDTAFQSFVGVPLFNGESRMVGHVALFFNEPVVDGDSLRLTVELTELFSQKIQAELNRMNADHARDNLLGELRRLVEQLEHESMTCALTGLYNRRYFNHRMTQFHTPASGPTSYALLLIDIDHFKRINDTFGHDVGDDVLRHVAEALRRSTRGGGEEVYRLGGDELAVIVAGEIGCDSLRRLGERLSRAISRGWRQLRPGLLAPTLSIGATRRACTDEAWEDVYIRADRALYASKRRGRHQTTVLEEAELEPTA